MVMRLRDFAAGSRAGYRGAGKVTGEEIGMFAAKRDDGSDGRALGMEAEMFFGLEMTASRSQNERQVASAGRRCPRKKTLQRTARRRGGEKERRRP